MAGIGALQRQLEAWLAAIKEAPLMMATIGLAIAAIIIIAILYWRRARHPRGPRSLSRETKAALSAALDGRCDATFPVSCRAEDEEARAYAEDFVEALRRAGCDAILTHELRLKPDAVGVYIVIARRKSIPGAEALAHAMRAARIDFQVAFDSDVLPEQLAGPDGFALIIGKAR